jgi:peroxiredoxin
LTEACYAFFGKKLPEYPKLSLTTIDGQKFDLEQKRSKAILVFFWTSWCGNCRQEMVVLNKFYADYKNKNFEIIGISLDEKNEREKAIRLAQNLPFTNAIIEDNRNENAINEFGEPNLIPTNYLIDKNGKLRQDLMPRAGFTEENFAETINNLL